MVGLFSLSTSTKVKITAFGASNTQDNLVNNNNRTYVAQASGRFKSGVTLVNVAQGGISASSSNSADFASFAAPQYDGSKAVNILTLQYGGGNAGDLTSDPATVTPFYNNIVGIAQKWKALGAGTKVVVFTTWAYGCADSQTVTNYTNANTLILANNTDFDVVINSGSILVALQPTTSCPLTSITPDCNHLTEYGHSFVRDPYITAVNSVF